MHQDDRAALTYCIDDPGEREHASFAGAEVQIQPANQSTAFRKVAIILILLYEMVIIANNHLN